VKLVKLNAKIADSLILASSNLCLAAAGFILANTSYAILCVAVFWGVLPFSLLMTIGFWVRDIGGVFRRQAKVAAVISVPVLLFEIWLGFHHLNM
jgi:hypothetical protein